MTKGQLGRKAAKRQESVEAQLALLGAALARLEHDTLRVRQAIRRANLQDLLGQVVEDHRIIARDIRVVQNFLRDLWETGQEERWKE